MKKVIITGSTGMVGKGVLLECLDSSEIEKVLVVNRSAIDIKHAKLEEVLLKDFSNFESIKDQFSAYDACFHCMGVSSSGMSEEKYTTLTFGFTKSLADALFSANSKMMVTYVSGMGTDSTEKTGSMWTRVKGKTENYILNKGFSKAIMFRPGFIIPEKALKSKTKLYNALYTIMKPFFGLLKKSKNVTTTTKIGLAMIASLTQNFEKTHIENSDINAITQKN